MCTILINAAVMCNVWNFHSQLLLNDINNVLCILHANGIVFGDLRDANILCLTSKACAMLIDFDWCGKDGEDRYTVMLNPSNAWPEDDLPYSIMHKAHDAWQLNQLAAL